MNKEYLLFSKTYSDLNNYFNRIWIVHQKLQIKMMELKRKKKNNNG